MNLSMEQAGAQVMRRCRQLRDVLDEQGWRGVGDRTRDAVARWLAPETPPFPVASEDVLAADLARPFVPAVAAVQSGEPLSLNWVITPRDRVSSAQATLFRIVNGLQSRGHDNRLYVYEACVGDHSHFDSMAREHYGFRGPVDRVQGGLRDAHALIATAWSTAYPVFNARCAGGRFYFVQDLEPGLHPAGSASLLAENTYRMGFRGLTAGRWIAARLRNDYGMLAEHFDIGCDSDAFGRRAGMRRSGIVFGARPNDPRWGLELGLFALAAFARRRPEVPIHLYGERIAAPPFACTQHGDIDSMALNGLYNRCYAGLCLSFTNASPVPQDMLAAGCIPVVNDAPHNRAVLDNPFIAYAPPTPHALASALETAVDTEDFEALSRSAAGSVRRVSWDETVSTVEGLLRKGLEDSHARPRVRKRAQPLVAVSANQST